MSERVKWKCRKIRDEWNLLECKNAKYEMVREEMGIFCEHDGEEQICEHMEVWVPHDGLIGVRGERKASVEGVRA